MKEGFTIIKMARRLALRLLADHDCKVKLHSMVGDVDKIYTTDHTWREVLDEGDCVFIKEQGKAHDYHYITHIEYTNRFGITHFMEVDWE